MTHLLLPALLLLLLLSFSDASPSAATIAISHSTATVCGILASADPLSIICSSLSSSTPFPLSPNASFSSVSGGRDFLCGLGPGGDTHSNSSIFCWSPATNYSSPFLPPKRLYGGPALAELAVGEDHVAAVEPGVGIHFWRGGGRFKSVVAGNFTSLTSGDGFSCGINNGAVTCWGNQIGQAIEKGFSTIPMSTIVAGGSRACGMSIVGFLICNSQNISAPPFQFSGFAVGATHTCAIRRANGTVVCWAAAAASSAGFSPAGDTSFEALVAGGNLTCGLTSGNFSVLCWDWDLKRPSPSMVSLPLPPVLPGVCRQDISSCSCGDFPNYQKLCSGTGVICKSCDAPEPSDSPPPQSSPSPPVAEPGRKAGKGFLAFAIVGSVGGLAGVCTVVYCLVVGVCRQKKVHNSVQPTLSGAASGGNGNSPPTPPDALFSSPSKSVRSRSKSLIFLRQGSRIMRRQRSGPSSSRHERAEEFTLKELADATGNFAAEAKIGAGSFGTVYRGRLSDGRDVAIKRSESGPRTNRFQEKESAFQSELAFLSRLHHKHLVGLVGFCEEREERLLVYEFMKNGALYDHLHSKTVTAAAADGGSQCGGVLNSWKMRIKVLLDASRGIEYLHSYAVPPIIHRDIKSSNILLDASWTARVSDFGLSLNGPESDGAHILINAAGTVGYMDPEYYGLYHLTVKSDVYGLGVVMLEALTGKRAVFKEGDGEPTSVVDYAVPRIAEGDVAKVLDPRVAPPGPREVEAVELVAYTAMHCVRSEGKERPAMTDVVANLENALAQLDHSHGSISSASITSLD